MALMTRLPAVSATSSGCVLRTVMEKVMRIINSISHSINQSINLAYSFIKHCKMFYNVNNVNAQLWQVHEQNEERLQLLKTNKQNHLTDTVGAKVPWNFRSRERKLHGTFAPGSESSNPRTFVPGTKVP